MFLNVLNHNIINMNAIFFNVYLYKKINVQNAM
jgi:hypothetical protein